MGAAPPVPPHRATYGDPPRVTHPPAQGAFQGTSAAPQSPGSAAAQPNTLDYSSRGAEMWEFWTAAWWRQRRNLMSAGLALIGLGLGLAMSYWVFPGLLMGVGGFLVGQALPLGDER